MPVITIKEAASKCSMEPKNIHTYITRGKLIKRKDNLIDDSHPVNIAFFAKHSKAKTEEIQEMQEVIEVVKPETTEVKEPKQPKEHKQRKVSNTDNDYSRFDIANNLDRLKAQKLTEEIIALKLKNQRLEGEVIETELIKQATFEVVNAFRTNLLLAAKNTLRNALGDLGATNEQLTKSAANLEVLFNTHTSDAIENVKTSIERIL